MTQSSLAATQVLCTYPEIRVIGHLLADGADNETIARRAGCQVETVRTHLRRIYARTGHGSRAELIVNILRGDTQIIDPEGRRVRF